MKYYIAVFFPVPEGGYAIQFPDFPEALTQGDTLEEGMEMAADALSVTIEEYVKERRDIPEPSGMESVTQWAGKQRMEAGASINGDPLLQLFRAPEIDKTPVRVSVSLAKNILDDVDEKARIAGMTRSGFLARAAQAYQVTE